MGLRLPSFSVLPSHTMTVILDEVAYRITLTYRPRMGAWYFDLRLLDGTAVALGRRVTPKSGPLLGVSVVGGPSSLLVVVGPDPYRREDLGGVVVIVSHTIAELQALDTSVAVAGPTVVVA